jgi:hypothetical protein
MNKWLVDISIGAVVLGIVGPILFLVDSQHIALQQRQAQAEPSVLEACTDIAAHAQGAYFGTVKERCLVKFDQRYAQASRAGGDK